MAAPTEDPLAVDVVTVGTLPPEARTDAWTELLAAFQGRVRCQYKPGQVFEGEAIRVRSTTYQAVAWRSNPLVVTRDMNLIRRDVENGDYRLLFAATGEVGLKQAGRDLVLRPGQAGLLALSNPLVLNQRQPGRYLAINLPAAAIDQRLGGPPPLATALDTRSGLGRLMHDLAMGLVRERAALSAAQFDTAMDRLVELLCSLLSGMDDVEEGDHLAALAATVRRYVREHATDPLLNGPAVADELGWSLRQVQRALHHVGTTPRGLIKEERLLLARERLLSPSFRTATVTDLAGEVGFSSLSTFSTAFRERFGVRPTELRAR